MSDDNSLPEQSPEQAVFNMRAAREAQKFIPTADFKKTTLQLLSKFDGDTFRRLCRTAIKEGLTSVQALEEQCPGAIPRNADKTEKLWKLPSPVAIRTVLTYFSTLEKSAGEKQQWRHEAKERNYIAPVYAR